MNKELIKFLPTEELVELLNLTDCGLDRAGIPPFIQENNEDAHESILNYLQGDATCLLKAVEDGRFNSSDKWIIWNDELEAIYTFSTNEELFQYISPNTIADLFEQNEIELTIKPIHHDNK